MFWCLELDPAYTTLHLCLRAYSNTASVPFTFDSTEPTGSSNDGCTLLCPAK